MDALIWPYGGRGRLLQATAALSIASAAIHIVVAPDHFAEWWGYGLVFLGAAVGQAGLAGVLLYFTARAQAPRWRLPTLIGGAIANASIAALYVLTRTAGVPLGPNVGDVEAFSAGGALSTAAEVATAAVLLFIVATSRENSRSRLSLTPSMRRSGHLSDKELFLGAGAMIALVATITALPVVFTAREGGMGPGSALLMGEALLVGATAFGGGSAVLAARWVPPGSLLLSSAAMTLGAFVAAAFEDHVGLLAINVAYVVIGLAAGMALTEVFARAAEGSRERSAFAFAALLVGAAVASRLPIIGAIPGLIWLVLACALLAVLWWVQTKSMSSHTDGTVDAHESVMVHVRPAVSLLAISAGIVATLASSDSTGMLALMLRSPLGARDLASLDASRATLLIAGGVLIAVGSFALWPRSRPAGSVVSTTCAVALTGLAGAGTVVILAYVVPADIIPGQRAFSGIGAVSVLATAIGITLGALSIARGTTLWILAVSGATVLGVVTLVVTGVGGGVAPAMTAPLGALGAAATAGLGIGVASVALRYGLALVPDPLKRGAAAAGVTAAAFGSFAGLQIGGGVGAQLSRGETGMPGAVALALAAAGAVVLSAAVRPSTDRG